MYEGVVKDYTGLDVTPQNFLDILTGDAEEMMGIGSGKVIEIRDFANCLISIGSSCLITLAW